jgi:DNA polymerase-3 subunit epsilon
LIFSFRKTPLDGAAWAVVDCETSGLDARRDRLLSVAAVEVSGARIRIGSAYNAVLRQAAPSSGANILVHGIGGEAQLAGRPSAQVLPELAAFIEGKVAAAFHAPFDLQVLKEAFAQAKVAMPRLQWIDLARVAPALFPERAAKTLEDWLAEFSIVNPARHDALGDAYATAELLLVLLAAAKRQGVGTVEALAGLAAATRWIGGRA